MSTPPSNHQDGSGPSQDGALNRKVALVIDDEDQLLRLILRVLEKGGFEVYSAMTAAAGLELFREHGDRIDVTLLDVQLPDMGAGELLPLMLADRSDCRVILTSGADLPSELETLMTSIGASFLRKPFVPKTLLRMLEEASENEGSNPAQAEFARGSA